MIVARALALFLAWALVSAAASAEVPDANSGARLVQSHGCTGCHGAQLQGGSDGPKLAGIEKTLKAVEIAAFIKHPSEPMPDFKFTDAQIADIVAYLSGLDGGEKGDRPTVSFDPPTPTGDTRIIVHFPSPAPRRVQAVGVLQADPEAARTDAVTLTRDGVHVWSGRMSFPRPGACIVEIMYDGNRIDAPISVASP